MSLHFLTGAGRSLLPDEARRLLYPLTLSLVLHALFFSPVPGVLPSPESPAARPSDLHANLHRAPVAAAIEAPGFNPATLTRATPLRQPETRVYSPSARRPAAEALSERKTELERPVLEPRPPVEAIRSGVDVSGLREYHLALGKKARQFRSYPEEARAAGYKGRVTMRLAISEMGFPLGISLLDSSSFGILDRAALEMMQLAASHTEIPESLRGQAFTIDLAVDYSPEDAP